MAKTAKVVCFDLWGTLIESGTLHYNRPYIQMLLDGKKSVPTEDAAIWLQEFICRRLMSERFETYEAMAELLLAEFQPANISPAVLAEAMRKENQSTFWLPRGVYWLNFFRELQRDRFSDELRLVLITNTTWPGWLDVERRHSFSRLFDKVYLSCEFGKAKPDSYVWKTAESWFPTIKPEDRLMIGDSQESDLAIPRARLWQVSEAYPFEDCGKADAAFNEAVLRRYIRNLW